MVNSSLTLTYFLYLNSYCHYQRESRDSSATRIFLLKKWDDATSDPEINHQV